MAPSRIINLTVLKNGGWLPEDLGTSPGPRGAWKVPLQVDLEALRTAVESVLGEPVASLTFLDKGRYHKIYVATFLQRQDVVIRVARNVCPQSKMASEAAVIKYLQLHTSVPVPRVLYVSLDAQHAVGGEFMIHEQAPGVRLDSVFSAMSLPQKTDLVRQLTRIIHEIFQERFERIGSLYQTEGGSFNVGPIVTYSYFHEDRWSLATNKGPFDSSENYLLSCLERERIAYIAQDEASLLRWNYDPQYPELIPNIEHMERIVRETGYNEEAPDSVSMCLHDLHIGNIFVDPLEPSRIVSVIDWECIRVLPTWLSLRPPKWVIPSLPGTKEYYPGEREERTHLSNSMAEVAASLSPEFAKALSVLELDSGALKRRMLFEEIERLEWQTAWMTVHALNCMGYKEGWPPSRFARITHVPSAGPAEKFARARTLALFNQSLKTDVVSNWPEFLKSLPT